MAITKDLSFGSRTVLVLGQTSLGPVHTSLPDGTLAYWLTQTKERGGEARRKRIIGDGGRWQSEEMGDSGKAACGASRENQERSMGGK